MMLSELNDRLRKLETFDNGFFKVQFDDAADSYMLLDNEDELIAIITDHTISFKGHNNNLSIKQMNLINGFMQTKPENRLPSEQYIVPIASETGLTVCYTKNKNEYALININIKYDKPEMYLFKEHELNGLYEWLYENKGYHYAKIADQATMKFADFLKENGDN